MLLLLPGVVAVGVEADKEDEEGRAEAEDGEDGQLGEGAVRGEEGREAVQHACKDLKMGWGDSVKIPYCTSCVTIGRSLFIRDRLGTRVCPG